MLNTTKISVFYYLYPLLAVVLYFLKAPSLQITTDINIFLALPLTRKYTYYVYKAIIE
jgi:hypothetical protein